MAVNQEKMDSAEVLLRANDALLQAKGFVLFTCSPSGDLKTVADLSLLSPAETQGLLSYTATLDIETEEEEEDEDREAWQKDADGR